MDRLLVLVDWKNWYYKRCYITKNKLQLQHNSHQNRSHILYRTIKPKFISKCKRCQMAHEILSRKSNVLGSTTPALNYSHRNKNSVVLAQKYQQDRREDSEINSRSSQGLIFRNVLNCTSERTSASVLGRQDASTLKRETGPRCSFWAKVNWKCVKDLSASLKESLGKIHSKHENSFTQWGLAGNYMEL